MGKRILLVDDEPLILKGLKYTLEQEGYETDSAMDGEEALAKGAQAITPAGFDWLGLLLVSIVLPAVLCPLINTLCRSLGWVKDGDLTLS